MNEISYRIGRRLKELSISKNNVKIRKGRRALHNEIKQLLIIQDAANNGDPHAQEVFKNIIDLNTRLSDLLRNLSKLDSASRTSALIDVYVFTLEKAAIIQRFNVPKMAASIYLKKLAREKREAIAQRKTGSHE